jgi:iron complex transport system substrate-binding protein
MKFGFWLLSFFISGMVLLTACQPGFEPPAQTTAANQAGQTATFTDDLGRSVTIKGIPQRIISLSPSNTEMVYALGLQEKLVGVTTYCNFPPEVKDKPKVSEYSKVDMEKVISVHPELILADSIHKAEVIPALEKLGIAVLTIDPPSLDKILQDIDLIGQATGKNTQAASLVSNLQNRIQVIMAKTSGLKTPEKPRIFFLTWHDPLWTAGSGTLINDLITRAGGNNIATDLDGHKQIDLETVIQRNPQIILVLGSMGVQNSSLNYIKTEYRFQATDALKHTQVFAIDSDIFARNTPRSVDGLEQLARLMHPELFK